MSHPPHHANMAVISSLYPPPAILSHRTITICSKTSKSMEKNLNDGETSKRVVVCGGGVIGVCTAYFLAKKGIAVTVVEKSAVACAASGKAGGFLALDWCDESPVSSLARASFDLHRSLAEELNGAESYGYRPLTTLSITVTESDQPVSGDLGLPAWVDGPVEGSATIGTTQTTAQVHPQLFTRKLLSTATEKYGVEVVIGKLVEVIMESGRVESVMLEDGRVIDTDTVVLAMGPWSGKFLMLSSVFKVYGTKAHSIVLEPKEPNAITPHALFLDYHSNDGEVLDPEVYPRPTGEVYVCGMASKEEVPDDPEQVRSNPESIQVLKRIAKTVSRYLDQENSLVKAEQACFLPTTEDGLPVIGEMPRIKGCYVATGHSCWGILNGPATGAALAELIVDGVATSVDLTQFSPSRFSKRRGRF